ncbi:MAG: hypothetical protein [Podoviridae sp. ctbj_2]|nr:MAG: hypothetical protein [Podoviridae sp. ctbj_2]
MIAFCIPECLTAASMNELEHTKECLSTRECAVYIAACNKPSKLQVYINTAMGLASQTLCAVVRHTESLTYQCVSEGMRENVAMKEGWDGHETRCVGSMTLVLTNIEYDAFPICKGVCEYERFSFSP